MTPSQKRMYWAEWRKCADSLLGHGYGDDELEAQRHRIHIEACGRDVSSQSIKNEQLDAILKHFRAYSSPGELSEQLRLIDQPEKRIAAFRKRAEKIAAEIGVEAPRRQAYLNALAGRICKRAWSDLSDVEIARICGVLVAQAGRK